MLLDAVVGLAFVTVALGLTTATVAMRSWWAAVGVAWWLGDIEALRLMHQGVLLGALADQDEGLARRLARLFCDALEGSGSHSEGSPSAVRCRRRPKPLDEVLVAVRGVELHQR